MITFRHKGNFEKTEKFFKQSVTSKYMDVFERYGKEGVSALASATPVESGKTASSWGYRIKRTRFGVTISWFNTNVFNKVNVAILIQYGHGTRNGGYVQGRDYINPAIKPIFDKISNDIWKEITKS